ncbi:MAG TPA: hypothetical protein VLM36_12165 [Sphingomicrobium sp.]|nr:hypothetical protein [Sphingomicrobium sp.]
MSGSTIRKYVTPWKFRREQAQRRIAALRERDGDICRRCRRPMRFDLPHGHDKGPAIESIVAGNDLQDEALDDYFLCHVRCNAAGADNTAEVTERIRRRSEAELFSRPRARAAGEG